MSRWLIPFFRTICFQCFIVAIILNSWNNYQEVRSYTQTPIIFTNPSFSAIWITILFYDLTMFNLRMPGTLMPISSSPIGLGARIIIEIILGNIMFIVLFVMILIFVVIEFRIESSVTRVDNHNIHLPRGLQRHYYILRILMFWYHNLHMLHHSGTMYRLGQFWYIRQVDRQTEYISQHIQIVIQWCFLMFIQMMALSHWYYHIEICIDQINIWIMKIWFVKFWSHIWLSWIQLEYNEISVNANFRKFICLISISIIFYI
jgi:hypothetical protein